MPDFIFNPAKLRQAFLSALPEETAVADAGDLPRVEHLYFPLSHARALHPDNMLVEGMRGAGKSLWWQALQSDTHRAALERRLPSTGISARTLVTAGFGALPDSSKYPGKDTLKELLKKKFEPRDIWRAVMAWHVFGPKAGMPERWNDRIEWLLADAERAENFFYRADRQLANEKKKHLTVFDALDRVAAAWPDIRKLVKGLFQVLLDFRSFRAIRAKAFVRPDMMESPDVTAFPDASKLLANKVELSWPRHELYGLLWQYLGNAPEGGDAFRAGCAHGFRLEWTLEESIWTMPEELRREEKVQREVFKALAGPWMGTDQRRGIPYTWLVSHLGDAFVRTSPRSFLAALRHAATEKTHHAYRYALHYEAIKRGVQEASRIRVNEIGEDYPWVKIVFEPLLGLAVPCSYEDIATRWGVQEMTGYLNFDNLESGQMPPSRADRGWLGVRADLEKLGIFYTMTDGRINIPDVYRVGFNLKRKGGIKPVR